jgi:hypothetical protein
MGFTKVLGSKVRSHRQLVGLVLLLTMGFVGNYYRWTLFFDIDFIFGSIAVLIVVCLYGTRWGTFAGFIAGLCTYVIWKHPYKGYFIDNEIFAKSQITKIILF